MSLVSGKLTATAFMLEIQDTSRSLMKFIRVTIRYLLAVGAAAALSLLVVGCESKPPDCADPKTVSTAKALVKESFVGQISRKFNNPQTEPDRIESARAIAEVRKYAEGISTEVSAVVTDGYSREARKHSCKGTFQVKTPNGNVFTMKDATFTVQGTAGDKDQFLVEVAQGGELIDALDGDFFQAYSAKYLHSPCVDTKLAAAKKELDAELVRLSDEAQAKGELFKGLSPVQEEEWQRGQLAKAEAACR